MPFRLSVAPAFFQRYINKSMYPFFKKGVVCYLHDILVASYTLEEKNIMEEVITKLTSNEVHSRLEKCNFYTDETEFLGYKICKGCILPKKNCCSVVASYTTPKNLKDTQSFIGLTNYFREFIPQYAAKVIPVHLVTVKARKQRIQWMEEAEASFRQ
jgi:hypothetical protein